MRILSLLFTMLFASILCVAQNHYEFGGSFDPSATPRFKGYASFLTPMDSTGYTYSYSSALVNRPVNGQFTYTIQTGIRRKSPIQPIPICTLWIDAQGGVAVSQGATSGVFIGGGSITRPIDKAGRATAVLGGKAYVIPISGGTTIQVTAGVQF